MPLYDYKCEHCSAEFEIRQNFTDSVITPCPQCRGRARRCFSPVAIIFKGPGFYVTDSRQKSPTEEGDKP